jgi:hypothetical protein
VTIKVTFRDPRSLNPPNGFSADDFLGAVFDGATAAALDAGKRYDVPVLGITRERSAYS